MKQKHRNQKILPKRNEKSVHKQQNQTNLPPSSVRYSSNCVHSEEVSAFRRHAIWLPSHSLDKNNCVCTHVQLRGVVTAKLTHTYSRYYRHPAAMLVQTLGFVEMSSNGSSRLNDVWRCSTQMQAELVQKCKFNFVFQSFLSFHFETRTKQ